MTDSELFKAMEELSKANPEWRVAFMALLTHLGLRKNSWVDG